MRENSPFNSDNGFTGRAFWRANQNGFAVIMYESAARRALLLNSLVPIPTGNTPMRILRSDNPKKAHSTISQLAEDFREVGRVAGR